MRATLATALLLVTLAPRPAGADGPWTRSDGLAIDERVATRSTSAAAPQLACDAAGCLAVWDDARGTFAAPVGDDGQPTSTFATPVALGCHAPVLAPLADRFLVLCSAVLDASGRPEIRATLLALDGTIARATESLGGGQLPALVATPAGDGALAAWRAPQSGQVQLRRLGADRLRRPNGTQMSDGMKRKSSSGATTTTSCSSPSRSLSSIAAMNPAKLLPRMTMRLPMTAMRGGPRRAKTLREGDRPRYWAGKKSSSGCACAAAPRRGRPSESSIVAKSA
jgi:hypothetical protein